MKWYHILLLIALVSAAFLLGSYYSKEKFAIKQEQIQNPAPNLKPTLDSLILAQSQNANQVEILRGILISTQKNNVLLSAELLKMSDKIDRYTIERKDTGRYSPNISIKLPDSLFKQSAPIVIKENKPYSLEIKDSTIAIAAKITKDSLTLTKIEIPNTLILNDEIFNISPEKQIRTTTITNSNPLLNTKPITVINQNYSEKGIKTQKKKSWYKGTAVGAGVAFLITFLLK